MSRRDKERKAVRLAMHLIADSIRGLSEAQGVTPREVQQWIGSEYPNREVPNITDIRLSLERATIKGRLVKKNGKYDLPVESDWGNSGKKGCKRKMKKRRCRRSPSLLAKIKRKLRKLLGQRTQDPNKPAPMKRYSWVRGHCRKNKFRRRSHSRSGGGRSCARRRRKPRC